MRKPLIFVVLFSLILTMASCSRRGKVEPPKENIFRYSIESKIPTLDPADMTDVYGAEVASLYLEPLYTYHYLKRPYQVVPLLADGMPEISKDKKTYTIKLKRGVYFHDNACFESNKGKGRELKADDVIFTFERIADPKKVRNAFGSFEDRVVGINEFHKGQAKSIAGIQALDDYTVQFKLLAPWPRVLHVLGDVTTSILSRECTTYLDKKERTRDTPVGTGAYMLQEMNLGSKIIAVKNPNYHHDTYPTEGMPGQKEEGLLDDAGKAVPFIDKIVIEIINEVQPSWLKFMAGEQEMAKVPKDDLPGIVKDGKLASKELVDRGVRLYTGFSGDVTVQVFNLKDSSPWGQKKELRKAFALALDVPDIIAAQYSGQAIRAESVLDPTMYGYDPDYRAPWSKRDVKQAKEILAKAGYPDGKGLPPVVNLSVSGTLGRQLDERMQRQLAEAGIEYKVENMTWPEMMRRKQERNFMSYGVGMVSSIPDPDDVTGMVMTKNIKVGGNSAGYSNPEIDKLANEIELSENSPARLAKIKRLRDVINDDLPYVPMAHRISIQPVQPWVKNHVFTPQTFRGRWMKFHKVEFGAKK